MASPDSTGLDHVLDALAHPHRRALVYVLGLQPFAISELARMRELSLPAIHKHIKVLERAGLVRRHKQGRTTYLTLRGQPLKELQDWVGQFHPYWDTEQASYENYADYLARTADHPDTRTAAEKETS